jgi:hypothetical protein
VDGGPVTFHCEVIPVWSNNSSSLAVFETLKYFNADEFIEGTGENTEEKEQIVTTTRDRSHAKNKIFCSPFWTAAIFYSSLVLD